jgi:hypothetical protein
MKLSLTPNWVHPVFFFPERLQPITIAAMCIVAINVLEPHAFDLESQYFILLFDKFSWLHGQQLGEYETWNEAVTQAQ